MKKFIQIIFCFFFACKAPAPVVESNQVLPGISIFLADHTHLVSGKNVGLITNPTGITPQFQSTIDALYEHPAVKLVALFGPEHGVRGDTPAGLFVGNAVDAKTGLPEFSLYGRTKKPTKQMLQNIEVLLFDIQDIGSRAYTYIYTMAYAMKAAAENGIPFIVLDRPNPLGGNLVEGPILDPKFRSFIGLYPIPYIYGLTIGELAGLFNTEFGINADLTVIPLKNWKRDMVFTDTGLPWVPTSPHVPRATTPFYIAATGCIGELQTVNEGVGYTLPFELLGAPWIDRDELAAELNSKNLPGVFFRPLIYKPYYTANQGKTLQGVQIHITEFKQFKPMLTQLVFMETLASLYPEHDMYESANLNMLDKAVGTDSVRTWLKSGNTALEIYNDFEPSLKEFEKIRQKYILYKE